MEMFPSRNFVEHINCDDTPNEQKTSYNIVENLNLTKLSALPQSTPETQPS